MASLEQMPLTFGERLAFKPLLFSSFLLMTQSKSGASHIGGRLFKSAASSALALSALAGGVLTTSVAQAGNLDLGPASVTFTDPLGFTATDKATLESESPMLTGTVHALELTNLFYPNPQTQIDTDFNVGGGDFAGPGNYTVTYSYLKELSSTPGTYFDQYFVQLTAIDGTGVKPTLLKELSLDPNFSSIFSSATQTGNGTTGPISINIPRGTTFYIRDTFTPNDGAIDAGLNQFRQTPGPLPILGAGAAFGFSRKLRGRIKASRTA